MMCRRDGSTRGVGMKLGALVSTALFDVELGVFVVTLLLTGYANLVLSDNQTVRPFYPHDASLWYSYRGDSITTEMLFVFYYFVASPALYALKLRELRAHKQLTTMQRHVVAARMAFGVWNATMVGILTVELLKGYVGRLRPSFAEACLAHPAPYGEDALSRVFRNDDDCPGDDRHLLHDMRRSFPSGHASLALGGGAYVQLCLLALAQGAHDGRTATAVFLLGCVPCAFGFGVGASRVVDAAHHVGDVAVGSLIGVWAAATQFWHVNARSARLLAPPAHSHTS
ncbi:unnamed protein product [Agarophyton chilense]|eukprot:gb/GEZJ01005301.1/.p1 GENE.gb/GEZJ01005301.1/~~gb/GEZJ01005301.1/.p1  ORF type:complete len:284 (-),score=18.29 gb/GEZJ01005301.1/:1409-2260(-)